MVVDSILLHVKSGPNDHRKDAPGYTCLVIYLVISLRLCIKSTQLESNWLLDQHRVSNELLYLETSSLSSVLPYLNFFNHEKHFQTGETTALTEKYCYLRDWFKYIFKSVSLSPLSFTRKSPHSMAEG